MTEELEAIVRELKDRHDIYECLVRYCRGLDRGDRELMASAYHPDALDHHGVCVGPFNGLIDWAFGVLTPNLQRMQHVLGNHLCEFDGTTAHCETYYITRTLNRTAPFFSTASGRYIDRFEKRDGRWAIAARSCVVDIMDEHTDPLGDIGDRLFRHTATDRSDTSYERPLRIDPAQFTG